jgi:hypothetical protein
MNPIKVQIRNFQSIESIDFEINGFTCLVGKTNVGKSAIVRAITSAILNNPVVGMVRHDRPHASVRLTSDHYDILWEKAERGLNRYHVNGKMYDKVGGNQLKEIEDLGFKSVKVGSDEILPWYASQFFPIFLLDRTGPQVTDFISDISRLNVIQDAIVLSNRRKKRKNDIIGLKEKDHSEDSAKLKRIVSLDALLLIGQDLQDQKQSIESYESSVLSASRLQELIADASSLLSNISAVETVSLPDVDTIDIELYAKASDLYTDLQSNAKSISVIKQISKIPISEEPIEFKEYAKIRSLPDISDLANKVSQLESINAVSIIDQDLSDHIDKLKSAESVHQSINKNRSFVGGISEIEFPISSVLDEYLNYRSLVQLASHMSTIAKEARSDKIKIADMENELKVVEADLSSIPTCSTCKQPVQHEH